MIKVGQREKWWEKSEARKMGREKWGEKSEGTKSGVKMWQREKWGDKIWAQSGA